METAKEKIIQLLIRSTTIFPNNDHIPVTIYKQVYDPSNHTAEEIASGFEDLFSRNSWGDMWRDIVYPYPHYHSTAYEVLGVFAGSDQVRLGGDDPLTSTTVSLHPGDVIILPPGVAHESLGSSEDFSCVGAYPNGQIPDLLRADADRLQAQRNIDAVPKYQKDPVTGQLS